ncbi:hypothetical protein C2E23DRAFT_891448 [Lenzites betulinus]|nr:hypothetical protein C2E23DRAFT_891448 [Lenzites betulinus]
MSFSDSSTPAANINIYELMKMVGAMNVTYGSIYLSSTRAVPDTSAVTPRACKKASAHVEESTVATNRLGTTKVQVECEITALHDEIQGHDEERAKAANDVKAAVSGKFKESARVEMIAFMKAQIEIEVKKQVPIQIEEQLVREHLEKSLEDHVKEGGEQLVWLEAATGNVRARAENAKILSYQADRTTPFARVVRRDNTSSEVWPADLASLMGYSEETIGKLLKDYTLYDQGHRKTKVNTFLAYIGVGMRLH